MEKLLKTIMGNRGAPPAAAPRVSVDPELALSEVGVFSVELSPEGALVLIAANPAFQRFVDMAGRPGRMALRELTAREVGAQLERLAGECILNERPLTARIAYHRDDQTLWFLVQLHPLAAQDNRPTGVIGTLVEVSEMTRAEAQFAPSAAVDRYLPHAVDHMAEAVLICDITSFGMPIVHLNQSFLRVFEYERLEVIGRSLVNLMFPDVAAEVTELLQYAWSDGKAVWRELPCYTKTGKIFESEVVFDFHQSNQRNQAALLRVTFLGKRPKDYAPMSEEEHRQMQVQAILNAAGSIINDFNNLLAIIQDHPRLIAAAPNQIIAKMEASKRFATQAADEVVTLLRPEAAVPAGFAPPSLAPAPALNPYQDNNGHPPQTPVRNYAPGLPGAHNYAPGPAGYPPAAAPAHHHHHHQPQQPAVSPTDAFSNLSVAARKRVLIVDDEPALREIIAQMLNDLGFEARSAGSGEQAIALLNEEIPQRGINPFDVLILDYTMAGVNGMELLQAVRNYGMSSPVILMSGYFSPDARKQALSFQNVVIMEKPFRMQDLAGCVKRIAV